MLEREHELAQLDALIAEARAGNGGFAVIEAAAGLGKSRLLEAARNAAQSADLLPLSARATELERDFPYALVRQLFQAPLAAMSEAERAAAFEGVAETGRHALGFDEPQTARPTRASDTFGVLHGLYWLTASLAARGALLLSVDDLQWADGASLAFLRFLLPRIEELPVLLAVACRPKDPDAARGVLRIVSDPSATHIVPRALSREAACVLIGAELDAKPDEAFVAACHDVSRGNPFLLSELVRTLATQSISPHADHASRVREIAPDRVARDVLVRLERLPASARVLARAVAILGDDADHSLVAAFAKLDAQAAAKSADALRAAAILDPAPPLRFIHPLVRTALYADVPAGERSAGHTEAAALLRSRAATPEQVAVHLLATEARGNRDTVQTLLDAGTRALANGAAPSAVTYLLRALQEPPPLDLRAAVLQPLMTASLRAVDPSVHAVVEAEILAELERSPHLLSRWASGLAVWMTLRGRIDKAIPILERAIEAAVQEQAFGRAFRLEAQLSSLAQLTPAAARSRVARFRDRIEPDSPSGRLAATFDVAWSLLHGEAAEGVEIARRALHEGKIFVEQPELLAPGWSMMTLWSADALDDAQRAAEHAIRVARERGAAPEMTGGWWLRGLTAALRGDLAAAEADLRQAMHVAQLGKLFAAIPLFAGGLADVLIARGELAAAAAVLDATPGIGHTLFWLSGPDLVRGRLLLAQGRLSEAAEQLLAFQRASEERGLDGIPFLQPRVDAARAFVGLGDRVRARELAEAELVHAERWGAASRIARVQRALALAIGGARGIELLEEAVAMLSTNPLRLDRAEALCELGMALRRARRRADAREPLREALELARRCGAAGLAKRAHDELSATGERVRRHTPIGVESLTASERRVAEMAADGMTNREIGQALFLTVKTIEMHLSAVYDKLGIGSRRQLPDALCNGVGQAPAHPTAARAP